MLGTPEELKESDWDCIYEIGAHIHQRLYRLWNSAAAVYAKDGDRVRINFSINEKGVRLYYPIDMSIQALRQMGDGEAIANLAITLFERSLGQYDETPS